MVNLELYRVFYTVVKCGSLTRAAEKLHISHSAVSQSIKQLETQLGATLFIRQHSGVELTEQAGKLIAGEVEKGLEYLDRAELKLEEMSKSAKGVLRIGASETIFQYVLSEKIVEYSRLYPQVKIELISDVTPKILELMKEDKCDIGFLNLPFAPDDKIKIVGSVAYLHDIFIAGKAFGYLKDKKLGVRDLQDYPTLILEKNTVARDALDQYLNIHSLELKPSVELNNWGLMKQLVADGMGIGCIPREYAKHKIDSGLLVELSIEPPLATRSVGMALLKDVNMTFTLNAFMELFKGDKNE